MLVFRMGHEKIHCWVFIAAHPQGRQKHSLFIPSLHPSLAPEDKDNKVCLFLKVINGCGLH